jgi:hypothetical protein
MSDKILKAVGNDPNAPQSPDAAAMGPAERQGDLYSRGVEGKRKITGNK